MQDLPALEADTVSKKDLLRLLKAKDPKMQLKKTIVGEFTQFLSSEWGLIYKSHPENQWKSDQTENPHY